jgi:hypothetical protein
VKHRDNRPGIPPPILQSLQIDSVALIQSLHSQCVLHSIRRCIAKLCCIIRAVLFQKSARQILRNNLARRLRTTLTFSNDEGRQQRLNCEASLAGHYSPFITRC